MSNQFFNQGDKFAWNESNRKVTGIKKVATRPTQANGEKELASEEDSP